MAGIGEASAILGVAQIGLQLAQTLVTVIGDYRDAAININRLRDEIHLTSICLQQLGDLAQEGRLIAGRGVLEATNLRERCRAVLWEIRMVIKKGDNPLHPEDISKEDIDVSYFTSWKWALWTKKHLEEPRLELDRLKDSMTLTFVTHMAILANSEFERKKYAAQIPGYKRSCRWAEDRYRNDESLPEEPNIPPQILEAGPEEWDQYLLWKENRDQPAVDPSVALPAMLESKPKTEYQAWSMDPFVGRVQMPVTEDWLRQATAQAQSSEEMWKVHSKLKPWYKKQIDELMEDLSAIGDKWSLFSLKVVHRSFFRRNENPPSLQLVVKGDVRDQNGVPFKIQQPTSRMDTQPHEIIIEPISGGVPEAVTYGGTFEMPDPETSMTDEELIQQQLGLYQPVEDPSKTPTYSESAEPKFY